MRRAAARWRSWTGCCRACDESAPARRAQLGFTLIEVLVALALMALVSLISWRGLASVSSARDWIESQAEDTDAIVRSLGQLGRDVELSYDGPVFDPVGGDTVALSAGVRLLRPPSGGAVLRSCARIRTAPACGSACAACVPTACGVPAAPRPRAARCRRSATARCCCRASGA